MMKSLVSHLLDSFQVYFCFLLCQFTVNYCSSRSSQNWRKLAKLKKTFPLSNQINHSPFFLLLFTLIIQIPFKHNEKSFLFTLSLFQLSLCRPVISKIAFAFAGCLHNVEKPLEHRHNINNDNKLAPTWWSFAPSSSPSRYVYVTIL